MKRIILTVLIMVGVSQLDACSYFQSAGSNDNRAKCQALRTRMMNYSMGQRYGSGTYTINSNRQDAQTAKMHQEYDQLGCND